MRLGTAIERLFDNYVYALDKEWVRDKVAWALYQTWKEVDNRKESGVLVQCYLREGCDHYGDKQVCGRCREYNLYSHTKTEPQTEYPCDTCANKGDHNGECSNCFMDSKPIRWKTPSHYKLKTELQTERNSE